MAKMQGFIIGAGLTAFALIAYFISTNDTLAFDTAICQWFYSIRSPWLTPVITAITYMGNWQSITLICIALLFFKKTRRHYGYPAALAAIFVTTLNKGIKQIFQRPRPDQSYFLIEQGGYSFTSGHAITSVVVFGLLIYLVRKHVKNKKTANLLTVLLAIPLVCIGLSRIYLGVHFPTDVLGGWCLGVVILTAIIVIDKKWIP